MLRWWSALVLLLAACGPGPTTAPAPKPPPKAEVYDLSEGLPGPVHVAFALRESADSPQRGGFYDLPWPSELWRRPDGTLDFRGFPGSDSALLAETMAGIASEIDAFSVSPVVYLRFTGAIDPARLPTPAASLEPGAKLWLWDVDETSPERGRRLPLEHRYYAEEQRYVPAHTLALKPLPGVILRPSTRYALVVLRDLTEPALGTTADFERSKWTRTHQRRDWERARQLHRPVLEQLAQEGIERRQVASLAVFRTQDPHATYQAMFDVATRLPAVHRPQIRRAAWDEPQTQGAADSPRWLVRGVYCTPNFQQHIDAAPFLEKGGTVKVAADGAAEVQPIAPGSPYHTDECGPRMRARFVLTVPRGPMPPSGWPLLVFAHGSTGDASSVDDYLAPWLAREGIASVSTDQPLHGGRDPVTARPGSRKPYRFKLGGIPIRMPVQGFGAELAFYYPLRPAALRGNLRQAAIDSVLLSRVVLQTDFAQPGPQGSALLPSSPDRPAPRFDPSRLLLAGHSQGCQSIAAHGAVDPLVRGVVLSGCGGDWRLAFVRRQDTNALEIVRLLLRMDERELDEFHPVFALVQTLLDPVDPQSWGPLYRQPLPGRRPRSVLQFHGLGDTMAVDDMALALAAALGAQPLEPMLHHSPTLDLLGLTPAPSVRANSPPRQATAALVQLAPAPGRNGHYVMFTHPQGPRLVRSFFSAIARGDDPPRVGPLPP